MQLGVLHTASTIDSAVAPTAAESTSVSSSALAATLATTLPPAARITAPTFAASTAAAESFPAVPSLPSVLPQPHRTEHGRELLASHTELCKHRRHAL